jgi:hypothetical protein
MRYAKQNFKDWSLDAMEEELIRLVRILLRSGDYNSGTHNVREMKRLLDRMSEEYGKLERGESSSYESLF